MCICHPCSWMIPEKRRFNPYPRISGSNPSELKPRHLLGLRVTKVILTSSQGLSQGYYCCDKTSWPKTTWDGKSYLAYTFTSLFITAASEHSPRTESCENAECSWEISKETRACGLGFFKTEVFSDCVFSLLPGIAGRRELSVAAGIQMSLWKHMFLPCVGCPGHSTPYSDDSS